MVIFNSYVKLPEGNHYIPLLYDKIDIDSPLWTTMKKMTIINHLFVA